MLREGFGAEAKTIKGDRCPRAFLLSSTGLIKNCTGHAFVCIIRYFGQSAASKLMHVFLVAGWWVTVDFDSKYKILWSKTRAHGVSIHEEEKKTKFKTRIYIIIPTP